VRCRPVWRWLGDGSLRIGALCRHVTLERSGILPHANEPDAPLIRDDKAGQTDNVCYRWEVGDAEGTDRGDAVDRVLAEGLQHHLFLGRVLPSIPTPAGGTQS
jgi:hypothetical protein